jgi:hypothetical protein
MLILGLCPTAFCSEGDSLTAIAYLSSIYTAYALRFFGGIQSQSAIAKIDLRSKQLSSHNICPMDGPL